MWPGTMTTFRAAREEPPVPFQRGTPLRCQEIFAPNLLMEGTKSNMTDPGMFENIRIKMFKSGTETVAELQVADVTEVLLIE